MPCAQAHFDQSHVNPNPGVETLVPQLSGDKLLWSTIQRRSTMGTSGVFRVCGSAAGANWRKTGQYHPCPAPCPGLPLTLGPRPAMKNIADSVYHCKTRCTSSGAEGEIRNRALTSRQPRHDHRDGSRNLGPCMDQTPPLTFHFAAHQPYHAAASTGRGRLPWSVAGIAAEASGCPASCIRRTSHPSAPHRPDPRPSHK